MGGCAGRPGTVSMRPVNTAVSWRPAEETLCGEENEEVAFSAFPLHVPCPQRLLPVGSITGTEDQERWHSRIRVTRKAWSHL